MPEVVITGLGPVASNGVGKENFWNALKEGRSGVRRISRFDPSGYPSQIAGEIPMEWIQEVKPYHKNGRGWSTHLVLTAAHLALQDAGVSQNEFSSLRSGIWVGISSSDMGVLESEYEIFLESGFTKSTNLFASFPHAAASELAVELKCSGEVVTVSAGCPSGVFSIIYAVKSILQGNTTMALAGGGDAPLTPSAYASFCSAGLLSSLFNHDPQAASRPFDAMRDGGVLAEGAGMVLLEDAEQAASRGAKVYARIAGWSTSNAASPKQLKASIVSSLTGALQVEGLTPAMIDYISAHAPGDKFIDKMETKAIKEVFGSHTYNLPVSSIKSMIGNPLAAAGPLQVIATAQVIQDRFIPPTINYHFPDPSCDLDCVPNKGRVARVNRAIINLHGMGGANASLVLTRE
ncbi:MAG: beta-ketoacyl-[acyl-carrier-protein] synthase family protein [Bacillota bacterium]|nr:beta-ketoacyl-[acyl-carrier-protein] synthase family protein [Bacillota bacterium]